MNRIARVSRKIELASSLLREGNGRDVVHIVGDKTWAKLEAFGLRRDLEISFPAPAAALPISVRLIREDDIPLLLDLEAPNIGREGRRERLNRLHLLRAGFANCYVAVTADETPCYMQWLIGAAENDHLREHFGGLFPVLRPDEALLEGAFTPEAFRGQRIMPCAMAQIAEKAAALGARWVITFVGQDNIPSLKGCKRSGFWPYSVREERWRLGRRRVLFSPLPEGTPYSFDVQPPAVEPQAASQAG